MKSNYARLTQIAQYLKQLDNPVDAELVLDAAKALNDAKIIADKVRDIIPAKFVPDIADTIGNASVKIVSFSNVCTHDWDKPEGLEANCTKCGCWRTGNEW